MTRRIVWALYWAVTVTIAAVASLAAAIPFNGDTASFAGLVAAAGVGFVGLACAPATPNTRKDVRP